MIFDYSIIKILHAHSLKLVLQSLFEKQHPFPHYFPSSEENTSNS